MKTDEEIEYQYYKAQGLDVVDIGSVAQLRKVVDAKLEARGYKPMVGYQTKKKLMAINKKY
jgi:hypothetical protein